ncbi:MAG: hypothetical protein H0W73_09005 [Bacteroidetes bacterium]|nr:hypothetical protein [Bacteroidota bacterium]
MFVFLSKLSAYSVNDTLQLKHIADSLLLNKKYYEASIFYQKLDFFSQSETMKNEAKFSAANCYKQYNNYTAGINQLNSIGIEGAADSVIFRVKYQSALMSYLNNDLTQAESFLEQLNYLIKDSSYIIKSLMLHVFVLNEQYKWTKAKEKLGKLNNGLNLNNSEAFNFNKRVIDSIYSTKNIPKLKNVEKAGRISTFFPGFGQCYAGNYAEGISSFFAIAVIAGAMVAGVIYQYYFTSIFVGNLLIGKFYLGGIKRAEFLAEKYNYLHSKNYNQSLKEQVKQHFIN